MLYNRVQNWHFVLLGSYFRFQTEKNILVSCSKGFFTFDSKLQTYFVIISHPGISKYLDMKQIISNRNMKKKY